MCRSCGDCRYRPCIVSECYFPRFASPWPHPRVRQAVLADSLPRVTVQSPPRRLGAAPCWKCYSKHYKLIICVLGKYTMRQARPSRVSLPRQYIVITKRAVRDMMGKRPSLPVGVRGGLEPHLQRVLAITPRAPFLVPQRL